MGELKGFFRTILKTFLFMIFLLAAILSVLIGTASIFAFFYKTIYPTNEIYYISNSSQQYLTYFTSISVIGLLIIYRENRKFKKQSRKIKESDGEFASGRNNKFNFYSVIFISIISIILITFYLSFNYYNIFYEDHFTKVKIFKEDKTYDIEDVNSFTVSNAKSYDLKNFSMKLYMTDGENLELFDGEYTSKAFDDKYDTYEYAAKLSKDLQSRGVTKQVIGKEKILKDFGYMDEPYLSYLNILLE